MKLHTFSKLLVFLSFVATLFSCNKYTSQQLVLSPDKNVTAYLEINDGKAFYNLVLSGAPVLEHSRLGITMKEADFSENLTLDSVSAITAVNDTYTMLYGKKKGISYQANKRIFHLSNKDGKMLDIIFQVSDNGLAFRYYFPGKTDSVQHITAELTTYNFPEATKAWIQEIAKTKSGWCNTNPSYEEYYQQDIDVKNLPDTLAGWIYPALFKAGTSWALISETFPEQNYCGTRLKSKQGDSEIHVGFPEKEEGFDKLAVYPESTLPWATPWRVVAVGAQLKDIVESTLVTDVSAPAKAGDYSFVKPGRSSWSWVLLKDDSTVYNVQKRFVDYASKMGWEYCLVDADWDRKIGKPKIEALATYAKTKNVGLILWYNSSGGWNQTTYSPKSALLTAEARAKEFEWLKKTGIKGVKVDFFGGDGQSMMAYYIDILNDAATYGIMVNYHGCTLPRGLQRTYPNLVNMEAIRGMEFVTFFQGNADKQPNHCCVIPFTRNVFDPMDFTPVAFSELSSTKRKTSNAFELALAYVFNGGIQHFAETPEGMAKVPVYVQELMKETSVAWDDTRFVDGYPGKYVIIARKKVNTWYVAAINGDTTVQHVKPDLSFIESKTGSIVTDGENNRSFMQWAYNQGSELTIAPSGGFVIKF